MQIQRSFVLVLIIEWMYCIIRVVPPEIFGPYRGDAISRRFFILK